MKCYVIRETTGYPTVIHNGQVVKLSLGEQFTEDELASLTCETNVTYLCTEDNSVATKEPGKSVKPAPVAKAAPVVEPVVQEETPAE